MNIKQFFLSCLTLGTFLTNYAAEETITQQHILNTWERTRLFVMKKNQEGSFIPKEGPRSHLIEQQQIVFLASIILSPEVSEYKRDVARATLKFACTEKTDIVQEALDYLIINQEYRYISPLINAGANIDNDDQLKIILKARAKSLNCNGFWSRMLGQNCECQEIEKSHSFLEKAKAK